MCQAKKQLQKTSYLKLDYKSMTLVWQTNNVSTLRVKTSYYQWQKEEEEEEAIVNQCIS